MPRTDKHTRKNADPSCPLCRNVAFEVLYPVTARMTAEHMYNYAGSEEEVGRLEGIIQSLWGKDAARMLRCGNCRLVFADPFIAGSGEFYSAVYVKDSFYPDWKWDYEITFRDLQDIVRSRVQVNPEKKGIKLQNPGRTSLLEIGAGNGAFVKRLTAGLFQKENILCTEYSEYGTEQIRNLGIRCVSEPVESLVNPENKDKFDFVCMFQVLEHMDRLDVLFDALNQLTGGKAILYITVPSEPYRTFYDRLGHHLDTPPNHLTRWNRESLETLGRQFGWRLAGHRIQPMAYREKLKRLIFERLEYHKLFRSSDWTGRKLPAGRKVGLALTVAGLMLIYPLAAIRLLNRQMGISQWVKFEKE